MRKQLANIALVCAVQYAAMGLGSVWGLAIVAHRGHWLHIPWSGAGALAVLMLGVDWLRYLASRRLRTAVPVIPWVSMTLSCYASWLIYAEAFLWYEDDFSFVTAVMLLLPFLLAIGPLARAGAWLAVAGSALFFATSIAMLTRNGCSITGGSGFFWGWVS
jgi:hypothetical protein